MWSSRGWALLPASLGDTEAFRLPWLKCDAERILFSALTHRSWEKQERSSSLSDRASLSSAYAVPRSHSCLVPCSRANHWSPCL